MRVVLGFLGAVLLVSDASQIALAVQPQSISHRMDTRHEVSFEFFSPQERSIFYKYQRDRPPFMMDYSYTFYMALPGLRDVTLGAGLRGRAIGPHVIRDMGQVNNYALSSVNWLYVTGRYLATSHRRQFVTSQFVASYERQPEHDEYDGSMDRYRGGLIMARPLGAIQATGNWIITSCGPQLWTMLSGGLSIGSERVVLGGKYEHHEGVGVEQTYLRREAYLDFISEEAKGMRLAVGSYRFTNNHDLGGKGWQFFRIAVTL